ncbi:hypothetical protein F4819DRAFT_444779 [Hypoxylon fuscum]|nr:hypothetical protein F4819DRAFT_444779 [Hypoxylon fuscum]
MSKIVTKKLLGSVLTPSGKNVAISAATRTTNWTRTDAAAELMKESLEAAIEKNEDVLPPGTTEVCTRETTHMSPSDSRSHITAVCFNKKGDPISTVHLATDKK